VIKKIGIFFSSLIISLFITNVFFSIFKIEEKLTPFAFPDSFKVAKNTRLFFADKKRIFKLADNPENNNVFPSNTNRQTWNIDKMGFRPDYKPNDKLDENSYVILMIGDSFTYCGEVPHSDSYPAILEKKLLENFPNINVINAGVPGYGPDQQLIYLRELLLKINPNLVVWNIYENDITDTNYYCLFQNDNEKLREIQAWKNNVYRQGIIVDTLPWLIARQPITKIATHFIGKPFGGNTALPISTIGCTEPITNEYLKKLGEKVNIILQTAKEETISTGVKIEFILMPNQQSFIKQEENIEELIKIEIIKQLAIFKNTPLLDLTKEFKKYELDENINIYNDFYLSEKEEPDVFSRHLNSKGNTLAAEKVQEYLVNKYYFTKNNANLCSMP